MASMSVSGVVSGMDWDSMIDEIITNAAKPAQVKVAKKTNLTNKKSLFEEMKVTMNSLQSSLSPLKLPSTYKAKEIDIERIDTSGSYKGVLTATVNADAEVNVWDVKVNKLATAQVNRSKQITSSTLSSTLSGLTSSKFYVNMGGQKVAIDVNSTDSLQALKSRINNTLKTLDNPLAVTASVVDNKLILKSDDTGLGTRTATETINYRSSGINTLSNISVTSDNASNLKITKGGTSYTYGTDFTVANGNEIRWKQYDRSTEVALNDKVNVKYRMAAGDVYKTTGTYGSSEAEISRFSMIDKGTLGSRVKIKDSEGNTYTYGEDFTIENNKVVWLDEEESTTNEPTSYTVSYSKTETFSSSIAGTKEAATATYTDEPDSYIVRYDDKATGSYTQIATANNQYKINIDLDFDKLSELYKASTGEDLGLYKVNASTAVYCIDPSEEARSAFSITDGTTTYEYGRDFVIRTKDNTTDTSNGNWQITWGRDSTATSTATVVNNYASAKGITGTALNSPASGQVTFSYDYDYDYTRTARVNASDNDKLLTTVFGSDFDMANFVPANLKIRGYTYDTDFTVDTDSTSANYGELQWIPKSETGSSREDPVNDSDLTALETAYNSAYGTSSIPTVTLTDADGVLRTYLDPEDASAFTMTSGNDTYEYGKDYVIRVNDDRNGYTISWAITNDANSDGTKDISDASTVVTTYTQYKDLSTYGMLAAPAENASYNFSFSKDVTTSASKTVSASDDDSDKTIANIFSEITVDPADYNDSSVITITDSSGNTYTPGTEYEFDSAGQLKWLEKTKEVSTLTEAPEDYIVSYSQPVDDVQFVTAQRKTAAYTNDVTSVEFSDLEQLYYDTFDTDMPLMEESTSTSTRVVVDFTDTNNTIKIVDENDVEYTYGVDFIVRSSVDATTSDTEKGRPSIIWARKGDGTGTMQGNVQRYANLAGLDTSDAKSPATGTNFTMFIAGAKTYTTENYEYDEDEVFTMASNDPANLTITSADGSTTYRYGVEYTIKDGQIKWILASDTTDSTRPESGSTYTLYYEAFSPLTATGTYDDTSSSQEVSITVDSGSGNYGDTALSYEQILSDLSLTSSSSSDTVATKFAANFTLTDNDGNEYEYGTDYTISQGTDTDSTSGEHSVIINWVDGGSTPLGDFTLTYSAGVSTGEVITTDGVTRSAADTIDPDTSSVLSGLYSTFSDAQDITITDGTNTYSLANGNFTISESTDGLSNPVIVWDSDSSWSEQDTTSATSFNVYVTTSSGTRLSYTGIRAAESNELTLNLGSPAYYSSSDFEDGTTTITQGTKTFYENEDFVIQDDANGNAQVVWLNDDSGGSEWYYPNPGTQYTINHTDSSGNTTSYTASRSASTALNMEDYGMTTANGSLTVQYGSKQGMLLDAEPNYDDNGDPIANTDGHAAIKAEYSIDIKDRGNGSYSFNWITPTLTSRSGLPSIGDELTVEYEYDANTFTLTDDGDGLLDLLGLNDDVTEAQDAELEVDGETVYRASNNIGADYDNELIKGVTIHLKGTGEVSIDVAHDAQKAVESIQTFVDTYNDLMTWMNTRMTESQLDEDTAATVDSDDFRMRWGLLHGNSLLRQTKSQMRSLTSQNFTFSFTQRKSSSEIYGTMAYNGLRSTSTLRLRIGTKYVDVTIEPTDTLATIAAKINDDTKGGPMNDIYYDDDGNKLQTPLIRVSTDNDILTINSTSGDEITMSGSAAMNALKMNYTYKGLYQIGIETTSDDYGKSGELVFDADEFMTALEDNPDEVQELMLKFVTQFDSWTKSMLNSSASGETSGTLTREIENIQTQIDSINEYLENYQDRLDRMEENLRTKYGNTETSLARLTQQASSIAAILNQLNGTGSGGGYGQASS